MSNNVGDLVSGDLQEPLIKEAKGGRQKQQDLLKSVVVILAPPRGVASSSGMALNHAVCTSETTAEEGLETAIEFDTISPQQTKMGEGGSTNDDMGRTHLDVDQQSTINTATSYTSNLPMPYDPCEFKEWGWLSTFSPFSSYFFLVEGQGKHLLLLFSVIMTLILRFDK